MAVEASCKENVAKFKLNAVKNLTLVDLRIQKRTVCVCDSECISKRRNQRELTKIIRKHTVGGMIAYALKKVIVIN